MKTDFKITPFLIERLRTSEIDNLQEFAENNPRVFERIFHNLRTTRYYTDLTYNIVMDMCVNGFTLNGKDVGLYELYKFFK